MEVELHKDLVDDLERVGHDLFGNLWEKKLAVR